MERTQQEWGGANYRQGVLCARQYGAAGRRGKTINKIGNAQKRTAETARAEHVVVVITTDGMENASREFSDEKVRKMIEHQKSKYGWEFIFLGANIDAIATAERFGISKDRATNYNADSAGTAL